MVDKLLLFYGIVLLAVSVSTVGIDGAAPSATTAIGLAIGIVLVLVSISDKIAAFYFRKSKKREIADKLRR